MKLWKARHSYFVVAASGGAFIGYVANGVRTNPPLASADLAAWVQAIGAIAAIVGAYILGERQSKAAMDNAPHVRYMDRKQRQDAMVAIMLAAKVSVSAVPTNLRNIPTHRLALALMYDERTFSGYIDALAAIPMHEIGSTPAVVGVLGFKNALIAMQKSIQTYLNDRAPAADVMFESGHAPDEGHRLNIDSLHSQLESCYEATVEAISAVG